MEVRHAAEASRWLRDIEAVEFGRILDHLVLVKVLMAETRMAEPFLPWHEWLPRRLFGPVGAAEEAGGCLSLHIPSTQICGRAAPPMCSRFRGSWFFSRSIPPVPAGLCGLTLLGLLARWRRPPSRAPIGGS